MERYRDRIGFWVIIIDKDMSLNTVKGMVVSMRKDRIYQEVVNICKEQGNSGTITGIDAMTLAKRLHLQRSNVSFDLNRLVEKDS